MTLTVFDIGKRYFEELHEFLLLYFQLFLELLVFFFQAIEIQFELLFDADVFADFGLCFLQGLFEDLVLGWFVFAK